MKGLGQYLHSKNLLFGVTIGYGTLTCSGYPGSMNFLELDAKTMADWEVDYVKMNSCIGRDHVKPDGFEKFSRLLNGTGRPMAFLCTYPLYETRYTKPKSVDWKRLQNNCNLVRALPNIYSSWGSVFNIIDEYKLRNDILPKVAGPGHYNDPDMLVLGNNGLSNDQKRAHIGHVVYVRCPTTDLS
ncbi:uncharacterized protein DC041_0011070 [Schistosoma bovis]|uniref:Alpha-galactosidase n=1 Tax=Schistosoma bovis TaxID=6184 RepID=A0A430QUD5_SCHBO|nr:uncharacterized protein DC041_0011070 [Schistosoma bovis]